MVQREIQALEISCFIQATEDAGKVRGSVSRAVGGLPEPEEEDLEGHFGNGILHLKWHLTGELAWASFLKLVSMLGDPVRAELVRDLESCLDDHGALYIRLDKQALVGGVAAFSSSDPIRIRVKPRGFLMKGPPRRFYERLLGGVPG